MRYRVTRQTLAVTGHTAGYIAHLERFFNFFAFILTFLVLTVNATDRYQSPYLRYLFDISDPELSTLLLIYQIKYGLCPFLEVQEWDTTINHTPLAVP